MSYKLFDEGEQQFLDVYLRNGTVPAGFYLGLANVSGGVVNMAETLTLSTLTGEATGGGYARKAVARSTVGWPTLALNSGDFQADAAAQTWTDSGTAMSTVNVIFLATTSDNTGKLIAAVDLSTSRSLQIGDTLTATFSLKMQ